MSRQRGLLTDALLINWLQPRFRDVQSEPELRRKLLRLAEMPITEENMLVADQKISHLCEIGKIKVEWRLDQGKFRVTLV